MRKGKVLVFRVPIHGTTVVLIEILDVPLNFFLIHLRVIVGLFLEFLEGSQRFALIIDFTLFIVDILQFQRFIIIHVGIFGLWHIAFSQNSTWIGPIADVGVPFFSVCAGVRL